MFLTEEKKRNGTSNSGIIHQPIDPAKRIPRPLHGGGDGRFIRAHIEFDRHRSDGGWLRSSGSVDPLAEGPQSVGPPRCRDDPATGLREVEAQVSADAGGRAGHHDDLAL